MEEKMIRTVYKEIVYYQFSHFPQSLVSHGFSTRFGGVSKGPYGTMNLGINSRDHDDLVLENYHRFASVFDLTPDDLVLSDQTHSDQIKRVSSIDRGKGIVTRQDYSSIDGLVTNERGIGLVTHHADCVPLFFFDPENKAIGIAHSGWKGTLNSIGKKMVHKMNEEFSTNPRHVVAGIGPSIGPCCYEIGEDVAILFYNKLKGLSEYIKPLSEGKYLLDLWGLNKQQLIEAGVPGNNVVKTHRCTKCNSDEFYSHRVQGNLRGTLAGLIALK